MNKPNSQSLDPELIHRAAAGDQSAFKAIVESHSHMVFRLAYRLTQDESAAEDVVQESFIKVFRKLKQFKFQSSLHSWIHRITVNTAMDYLRRQRHLEINTEPTALPEPEGNSSQLCAAEQDEIQQRTHQLLTQLSPLERAALSLRHFEGYSIKEIAQALKLGDSACKQAIFRAVKKLRLALEPWS